MVSVLKKKGLIMDNLPQILLFNDPKAKEIFGLEILPIGGLISHLLKINKISKVSMSAPASIVPNVSRQNKASSKKMPATRRVTRSRGKGNKEKLKNKVNTSGIQNLLKQMNMDEEGLQNLIKSTSLLANLMQKSH